jgi:glycosyltransferase involved in cell wall biosynthesis
VRPVVLHCIPGMGGGGAERQLSYLAGGMTAIGWDVAVALVTGGPNLDRLRANGAVVHQLEARHNHDPRILWALLRAIDRSKPDIVHVALLQMEILGGLAAELKGIPWVFSEHSSERAYPQTVKNRLRVWIADHADAVISNSHAGDAYWATRLDARVPRFVVPNVVPIEEIDRVEAATPERTGLDPAEKLVLFVGRFSAEKNLEVLVGALRRVTAEQNVVAVLAGTGPEETAIKRLVGDLGLRDRVRTPGYLDGIWAWIKRADVLASISLFEGRPNAVLEAMASGCPLVVSNVSAHREMLDDESARFVDPDDAEAVADALLDVLRDPVAAHARALCARRRAETWSVMNVVREYDRVYRRIIERRKLGGT